MHMVPNRARTHIHSNFTSHLAGVVTSEPVKSKKYLVHLVFHL